MRYFGIILLLLIAPCSVWSADYHIGAGQTYTSIAAFTGWQTLQPGDHVYIHPGTYKEHIFLNKSGTALNPIVIEGVLDGEGNRPILDGDGAITPTQFNGHLDDYDIGGGALLQGQGIIYIGYSQSADAWGYAPEYITVKNLDLKSATPEPYTFTNTIGAVQSYPDGSAGVYIKTGNHLTFENMVIRDNGNGFYAQGVDTMVHDITLRNSAIYNNGRTDGRADREHNLYVEASGLLIENNYFGPLHDGSLGAAIKTRGADEVIRYNEIYSGTRTLDLVAPENQKGAVGCDFTGSTVGSMYDEPGFFDTWVYGNTFVNKVVGTSPTSANLFHYGEDNCPDASRAGTLHFYNNTTYLDIPQSHFYYIRYFDLTSDRETVDLYNNVFISTQDTIVYAANLAGTINWLGGNWMTSGYTDLRPASTATWNETATILEGVNTGVLTSPSTSDYSVPSGSPLINNGVALPVGITAAHNVTLEYLAPQSTVTRLDVNDIGAFWTDGTGAAPTCDDGIQNQDETGPDCGGSCPDVCAPVCTPTNGGVEICGNAIDEDCDGFIDTCPPVSTSTRISGKFNGIIR